MTFLSKEHLRQHQKLLTRLQKEAKFAGFLNVNAPRCVDQWLKVTGKGVQPTDVIIRMDVRKPKPTIMAPQMLQQVTRRRVVDFFVKNFIKEDTLLELLFCIVRDQWR